MHPPTYYSYHNAPLSQLSASVATLPVYLFAHLSMNIDQHTHYSSCCYAKKNESASFIIYHYNIGFTAFRIIYLLASAQMVHLGHGSNFQKELDSIVDVQHGKVV